jgi:two-component sensor histidine kinase
VTDAAGRIRWLQTVKRPIISEDGKADQVLGVATDITARKQAEHALLSAHAELEQRVHDRTAELARVNEALLEEISERKRAEAQIKASLKEKEVLLREIHHRVKNNLQIVSSLLNLQSSAVDDQGTRVVFQESKDRIRSMALVHQQLYQSRDLARIDAVEYLHSLASNLFRSYGIDTNLIRLRIEMDQLELGVDTAIPCGLLINELVSNALKHAFPDGRPGEVRIELRARENGELLLRLSDDGIGFPAELDYRRTTTLGLRLVNTLIEQLGGTIQLNAGPGTAFEVRFAELRYKERI